MGEQAILLAHGAGGRLMSDLIERVFLSRFSGPDARVGDDSALLFLSNKLAFTTDAYVVEPLFFPGGDIGRLAIFGTVNDLATAGARPLWLSASFILEEGLEVSTVEAVAGSMADAAREAGVRVVTGDTKVVPRGAADKMFVSTAGVGTLLRPWPVSGAGAREGDAVIINGPIADHGIAVLSQREGLRFESDIRSDCAPLAKLVEAAMDASDQVHAMRDPTRGGAASALNDLAGQSGVCIEIDEQAVPVRDSVRAACEMLGLDPLVVANEGKMIMICAQRDARNVVEAVKKVPQGTEAAIIGRVLAEPAGQVRARTALGTSRIIDKPVGELLPRIC
jgi:hydrogenase expression/formation protein HypE